MKKRFFQPLAVLMSFLLLAASLTACNNTEQPVSETTAAPDITEGEETTESAETSAPFPGVVINMENIQSVVLVSSTFKADDMGKSILSAFETEWERRFGQAPERGNGRNEPEKDKIEIVIGKTAREGSEAFCERVKGLGDWAYGISVVEGRIFVAGTDFFPVYQALDYLLGSLITQREDGTPQIVLENGFEWFGEEKPEAADPEELLRSGKELAFYNVEKLASVPSVGNHRTLEGACSDGEFYYVGMLAAGSTVEKGIIHKIDMKTWEVLDTSEVLESEHTNDITYDSQHHRLVVNGSSSILTMVDPDTLDFIEQVEAGEWARGISYLPETNQYVFGQQYGYAITDENFRVISHIEDAFPKLTTQGIYCDGTYIYDPRWASNSKYQVIPVYTLEGEFIGPLHLYGIEGEPENITRDGNTFIMSCNLSNSIYRLILMEKTWWQF